MKNEVIGTIDSTCPVDYGFDIRGEIVLTKGLIVIGEVKGEAILTCDVKGVLGGSAFRSWRNRLAEYILKTEGLCKDFIGLRSIDHFDIAVNKGDVHGLIGPNGSGKSTFFNLEQILLS